MSLDPRLRDALRAKAVSVDPDVEHGLDVVRRRSARQAAIHPVAFAAIAVAVAVAFVVRAGGIGPLGANPGTQPANNGFGGPPPHVCALITVAELSAIVGASVTLTVPEVSETTSSYTASSCVYEYRPVRAGSPTPNVLLSITRYPDRDVARAQIGAGINDVRAVPGLGDAAAFYFNPPTTGLYVLRGSEVINVGGMMAAVVDPINAEQMNAIARIILSRL